MDIPQAMGNVLRAQKAKLNWTQCSRVEKEKKKTGFELGLCLGAGIYPSKSQFSYLWNGNINTFNVFKALGTQ